MAIVVLALAALVCAGVIVYPRATESTPQALTVTTFDPPDEAVLADSFPLQIATGPDGALWFAGQHAVGRLTPAGDVTMFPAADDANSATYTKPLEIAVGSDGSVWSIQAAIPKNSVYVPRPPSWSIQRITSSGQINTFAHPTSWAAPPNGIAAGSDGNLYALNADATTPGIERITASGEVTPIDLPDGLKSSAPPSQTLSCKACITRGPDGAIYFTAWSSRGEGEAPAIARLAADGAVTTFSHGPYGPPHDPGSEDARHEAKVYVGQQLNVWYVTDGVAHVTTNGLISTGSPEIGNASPHAEAAAAGPDGSLWCTVDYTQFDVPYIGPYTTYQMVQVKPDGQVSGFNLSKSVTLDTLVAGQDGALWGITSGGTIARIALPS